MIASFCRAPALLLVALLLGGLGPPSAPQQWRAGVLRQARPVAFQTIQGRKRSVSVSYVLLGQGRIGFRLGHYDQRHGVVIDPVLQYSSYLGGSNTDIATALAVDGQGDAYLAGYTLSPDFPDTTGTQPYSGTYDVFVTKVVSGTGAIAYSTYLGGSGNEQAGGIAVDGQGNAYVTGQTGSADYPTTVPTFQVSALTVTAGVTSVVTTPLSVSIPPTGTDAFVTKLGPTGTISYSTRLGSLGGINALGDTWGRGIAVDKQGEAYVTGQTDSPDFPVTTLSPVGVTDPGTLVHGVCNPLTGLLSQPLTQTVTTALTTTGGLCYDAFVTRLSADGQALLYSTYLGGGRDDMGYGIAADSQGDAYVTGRTASPDFPVSGTVSGSLDNTSGGPLGGDYPACHQTTCADAFAVKLDTTSGGLVPLGLPAAQAPALWLLGSGSGGRSSGGLLGDVVMGTTGLLTLPLAGTLGATADAIVNGPSGVWGRYLGGSNADEGRGLALDPTAGASRQGGGVYIAGQTQSGDFPTSTGAYSQSLSGGTDAFVTKLLAATGAISYSTYLGGGGYDSADALAVDTSGHAYVTGQTYSGDYPLIGTLQGFSGTTGIAGAGVITTSLAVVTKLNKQGTALWYSTYLGGSGGDAGAGVGVDPIGDVWATGPTGSVDFLTLRPQQATLNNVAPGGSQSGAQDAFVSFIDNTTRHFSYGYDGLQRLVGVTETLGNAYAYGYDPVGNRTDVFVNGVNTLHDGYDAADEAITATTQLGTTQNSYDAAGNLTGDAATSYSYDALDRLTALTNTAQQAPTTYDYNGDGTLVAQTAGGTTTRYTQDVAANPDPGQSQDQQALAGLTPAVGAVPDQSGVNQSAASLATDQGTVSADGTSTSSATTAASDLAGQSAPLPVAPLIAAQPTTLGPVPATGSTNAGLSQVLQAMQQTSQGTSAPVDYLYGASRLASTSALNPQAHVWYVSDLQGSVRYAQDDTGSSGQSLNYDPVSPRYDPYGTIDRGADGDGIVAQPFGYRGELQDASTGLVDLRARMYNPASGQFLQRDPLEQQTGQAYAYAGDNPQTNADPTGQAYNAFGCAGDTYQQTAEAGAVRDILAFSNQGTHAGCNVAIPGHPNAGQETVVGDAGGDQLWVVRSLAQLLATPAAYQEAQGQAVQDVAALRQAGTRPPLFSTQGQGLFGLFGCKLVREDTALTGLRPGTDFNGARGPQAVEVGHSAGNPPVNVNVGQFIQPTGGQVPGVLFYQPYVTPPPGKTCLSSNFSFKGVLHCGYQFVVGDDIDTLRSNAGAFPKVVAVIDLSSNALVLVPFVGEGARVGVKVFAKTVLQATLHHAVDDAALKTADEVGVHVGQEDLSTLEHSGAGTETRDPQLDVPCKCFPAGTLVATRTGSVAIEKLHVGDLVLAEDPTTGKVEEESVQALIVRPVSPMVAVTLSDGSTITVQPDHPFWVDGGPGRHGAGWVKAGQLRPGDRLRTTRGKDHAVTVVRVRQNAGRAVVYTLTVAHDHTFFVGNARVLVHNCSPGDAGVDALFKDPSLADKVKSLLRSPNPDDVREGEAAYYAQEAGQQVVDVNVKFGVAPDNTEVDVITDRFIIEATNMEGGKLAQISDRINNVHGENPTGKTVILYAPRYGKYATRDILKAGGRVAKTPQDLQNILQGTP